MVAKQVVPWWEVAWWTSVEGQLVCHEVEGRPVARPSQQQCIESLPELHHHPPWPSEE